MSETLVLSLPWYISWYIWDKNSIFLSSPMKYTNCVLKKGKRVIQVLIYVAPPKESHKSPSGTRRWFYACDVNWERRYIATHNISRYVTMHGYMIEPTIDCWIHAQHSIKHQENVESKEFWFWRKWWDFLTK
jgi:hypothetical protein